MDTKNLEGMSIEQLEQVLEKKRAEAQEAANARRDAYMKLRAGFITKIKTEAFSAVKTMRAFYDLVTSESKAFREIMQEYGALKSNEQQTFSVNDDTFKIEVKANKVKRFDERADMAAARLIEFLKQWITGSEKGQNDPMYQLAMTLLERNRDGDLDYKSVSKLYSLEAEFNSPVYSEIMQLFRESNVVEASAINFYFYERTESGVWRKVEPSFNRM